MSINAAAPRTVVAGQKVADNQKEQQTKKSFTVAWHKSSATIGQTVGISGTAHTEIKNPALVTVDILFNNGKFVPADKVTIEGREIKAEWKVKAVKSGTFTVGVYDAEVRYNGGLPGKTNVPLRIVSNVNGGDFFG